MRYVPPFHLGSNIITLDIHVAVSRPPCIVVVGFARRVLAHYSDYVSSKFNFPSHDTRLVDFGVASSSLLLRTACLNVDVIHVLFTVLMFMTHST